MLRGVTVSGRKSELGFWKIKEGEGKERKGDMWPLPRWQEKEVHQETVTYATGKAFNTKKSQSIFLFREKQH